MLWRKVGISFSHLNGRVTHKFFDGIEVNTELQLFLVYRLIEKAVHPLL